MDHFSQSDLDRVKLQRDAINRSVLIARLGSLQGVEPDHAALLSQIIKKTSTRNAEFQCTFFENRKFGTLGTQYGWQQIVGENPERKFLLIQFQGTTSNLCNPVLARATTLIFRTGPLAYTTLTPADALTYARAGITNLLVGSEDVTVTGDNNFTQYDESPTNAITYVECREPLYRSALIVEGF